VRVKDTASGYPPGLCVGPMWVGTPSAKIRPMASVEYVVESYADYLRGLGQKFWQRFQTTRKNAPESALAEAMVIRVLQSCKVDPAVADAPGVGGRTSFACRGNRRNSWLRRHRCCQTG
jgi:hypothetical protein